MAGRPIFAIGYSFGAAVAARAIGKDPGGVLGLVCIALPVGFSSPDDFADLRERRLPKLFLAGSGDDICPVPALREFVGTLPEPNALVVLDATDHFFRSREPELASHILRFLDTPRPAP